VTDHPVSTAEAMAALRNSSHDLRASTSHDQRQAAEALLEKATAALDEGDVTRARKLVERTKALGHDDHEDAEVCSMAAHMGLFMLVSDVLEEEEPMVWLQAAEAVLPALDDAARAELLGVLLTIDADARLDPAERRVLHRLTRGAEPPASVFEGRVLDVDDVLQVLAATAAYDDAVDDLLAQP
jgi:hypothetical protein